MRKKLTKVTDPARIAQMTYSEDEQVNNQAESGLAWSPIGAIGTAKKVDEATPVMLFNGGGAVAFVKFGDSAMTAPVTAADGIPVPAGETLIVNSGKNEYVRASAATVFAYTSGNN